MWCLLRSVLLRYDEPQAEAGDGKLVVLAITSIARSPSVDRVPSVETELEGLLTVLRRALEAG
jgi:hypothetical protein